MSGGAHEEEVAPFSERIARLHPSSSPLPPVPPCFTPDTANHDIQGAPLWQRAGFYLREAVGFMGKVCLLADTHKAMKLKRALRQERKTSRKRSEKAVADICASDSVPDSGKTKPPTDAVSTAFGSGDFDAVYKVDGIDRYGDVRGDWTTAHLFLVMGTQLCVHLRRRRGLQRARYGKTHRGTRSTWSSRWSDSRNRDDQARAVPNTTRS